MTAGAGWEASQGTENSGGMEGHWLTKTSPLHAVQAVLSYNEGSGLRCFLGGLEELATAQTSPQLFLPASQVTLSWENHRDPQSRGPSWHLFVKVFA